MRSEMPQQTLVASPGTVALDEMVLAKTVIVAPVADLAPVLDKPAARTPKPRVEWVDLAKGLTISLVVLLHTTGMLVSRDLAPEIWTHINGFLQPIRMPLFFVASGLFSQGLLTMPWARMMRSRVAHLYYLYTLWLLVFFAAHNLLPREVRHGGYAKFENVVTGLVIPNSALWFIFGLAVFAIAAKAISGLPLAVQFGAATVLSIVGYGDYGVFSDLGFAWRNLAMYFVYFLLALHAKQLVVKFSQFASKRWLFAALGTYTAVYAFVVTFDVLGLNQLMLVVTTVGLGLGVLAAARLVGSPLGNVFQAIGKRTLPVCIMMDILIALAVYALIKVPQVAVLPGVPAVLPLLVAATVVATALLVHKLLLAGGMNFLFELHPRLRGIKPAPAKAA
jgi:fucose 4-O-acetylase-like acetyltransferase